MFGISVNDGFVILKPLALFVIGMVIYSLFVFKFYKFIARKDIFELNLNQYNKFEHAFMNKFLSTILYLVEYVILFPVFVAFWFGILTILISFLSEQAIESILLVSISLIGAVRVTSYYDEELSKDLAKMLPFALLGVFLLDVSNFSFHDWFGILYNLPNVWDTLKYYLLFVIGLEFVMRMGSALVHMLTPIPEEES
tara:strand:+ start:18 stop:608 length:591 start_codon:yes stop_codon:yes gene_type:complete